MCRKRNKRYVQPTPRRNSGLSDIESVLQELRIKLWQIIARNNSEELVDPLVKPIKNAMPYVENGREQSSDDDVSKIEPTLDEVLPLPQKEKSTPPKQEATEKKTNSKKTNSKKTSAHDLIAEDDGELPGQMTVDEAIAQAEGVAPSAKPSDVTSQSETLLVVKSEATSERQPKSDEMQADDDERPSLLARYFAWRRERADRKDYFAQLEVQVKNKNAACFELLDYLDELQGELQ
ncbi:MAG: hypothetical protein NC037_01065 [Bacteroides sp.]|nr:hypothetical protein [Bacillota bacterium]MCM1393513.1 hypothetical protein [[Eubacterium] siraeum]MCM1455106.1 hypothetical protein [Bacteroides sp.]